MTYTIDVQALAFARQMAAETGWPAADIYDAYMTHFGDKYPRVSVENSLRLIADNRMDGESIDDAMARVAEALNAAVAELEKRSHGQN